MTVMLASMVLSGLLDAFTGALKGLGYTLTAMMTSLICICGIRLVWITFGFPLDVFNSLTGLYLAYPISWFIALITVIVCLLVAFNRFKKKLATEGEEQDAAGESDGTEENVAEVPCKENASAT